MWDADTYISSKLALSPLAPPRLHITRVEYHLRIAARSGLLKASSHNLGREEAAFAPHRREENRQWLQHLVTDGEENARCTVSQA